MTKYITIKLSKEFVAYLQTLKEYRRETYEEVLKRVLGVKE